MIFEHGQSSERESNFMFLRTLSLLNLNKGKAWGRTSIGGGVVKMIHRVREELMRTE
jgi:hypothetical protein